MKIRASDWTGRIVEERGAPGPRGSLIVRVRVPHKPEPIFVEVREDQLTAALTPPKVGASALMTTAKNELRPPKIWPLEARKAK